MCLCFFFFLVSNWLVGRLSVIPFGTQSFLIHFFLFLLLLFHPGLLVWSTGVGPTEFIGSLPFVKTALGRLCIDGYLRVKDGKGKVSENVMSLGDCACNPAHPLPTTAQVAEQHGKWLAKHLNNLKAGEEPFQFRYLGQMSALSTGSAVTDLGEVTSITGWASWLGWRAVYFTKLGSLSNKLYVILNWSTTMLLGRDLTRW